MSLMKQDLSDSRYIRMESRRDGKCAECEGDITEGDPIFWDPKEYKAYCEPCGKELE